MQELEQIGMKGREKTVQELTNEEQQKSSEHHESNGTKLGLPLQTGNASLAAHI